MIDPGRGLSPRGGGGPSPLAQVKNVGHDLHEMINALIVPAAVLAALFITFGGAAGDAFKVWLGGRFVVLINALIWIAILIVTASAVVGAKHYAASNHAQGKLQVIGSGIALGILLVVVFVTQHWPQLLRGTFS